MKILRSIPVGLGILIAVIGIVVLGANKIELNTHTQNQNATPYTPASIETTATSQPTK